MKWIVAGCVALLGVGLPMVEGAEGDALAELSSADNAALDYWKACALLQEILTEDQYEMALFAEKELQQLPPKALAYRPEVGRWLLGERLMLEALHDAAAKEACLYAPEGQAGAKERALFRGAVKRIMLRALSAAKAHEFVGNDRAVVSIHIDLLRMMQHVDADDDWVSAYFTMNLLPLQMSDLAGYLSRVPPRDSVQLLVDELKGMERPFYAMKRMLDKESRDYVRWLLEEPEVAVERVNALYGDKIVRPGVDKLLNLTPAEQFVLIKKWAVGYRREMNRLGAGMDLPYAEAIQVVREIDGLVARAAKEKDNEDFNPLLPLLMPQMAGTYGQFTFAEANLNLLEVMCQAAVYRDFVGDWPDTIEILDQFSGGELPRDAFTGELMEYDIRGRMPSVSLDVPKSLVQPGGLLTKMNLRSQISDDEERVADLIRSIQRERQAEEDARKSAGKKKEQNRDDSKSLRSRVNRGLVY